MPSPAIFTEAETEAAAVFSPETGFHSNVVVTGGHAQLIWAKLEPDGTYALHTHEHEQVSMLVHGRMRLTVGDEVREDRPGRHVVCARERAAWRRGSRRRARGLR